MTDHKFFHETQIREMLEDYYIIYYDNLATAKLLKNECEEKINKKVLVVIRSFAADLNIKLDLKNKYLIERLYKFDTPIREVKKYD